MEANTDDTVQGVEPDSGPGMKFEIFDREDGRPGYRLMGLNGETVMTAEGFHGDGNCRRAIKRIKAAVKDAPIIRIKSAPKAEGL